MEIDWEEVKRNLEPISLENKFCSLWTDIHRMVPIDLIDPHSHPISPFPSLSCLLPPLSWRFIPALILHCVHRIECHRQDPAGSNHYSTDILAIGLPFLSQAYLTVSVNATPESATFRRQKAGYQQLQRQSQLSTANDRAVLPGCKSRRHFSNQSPDQPRTGGTGGLSFASKFRVVGQRLLESLL